MKYAHIVYNSSQKSQSGAAGFGVRCSTKGTPAELTIAMEENGIFSFTMAGPSLTVSTLADKPDAITQIVPTYFFMSIPLSDKNRAFVLGRKIAVGFDYPFYLDGSKRFGNYVVDSYVFPAPPTVKEFEILLEDAEPGSNHFIPSSPVPTHDNLEMKEISIGYKPDLPVEEKPFSSCTTLKVSTQAIELLFSFIQGSKEKKPVLVKTDIATPPRLMAELAMLVPQEQIENLTFITNHTDEGKKKGINIAFINEYYTFEIFKKQWVWLDLEAGSQCENAEAVLFRDTVKRYVEQGDFESIHKLVGWCLSSMYEKGKSFSRETQTQLYNYIYNYPAFCKELLASDSNLRLTLNDYFLSYPKEKDRFDISLQEWFNNLRDFDGLWQWIDYVIAVSPIDCKGAVEANKREITHKVFKSPESFAAFYAQFKKRFQEVLRFVDMAAFPENNGYLSAMPADWEKLYPLFLTDKVKNYGYMVERMIDDNIDSSMRQRIVEKEISHPEYINALVGILEKSDGKNEGRVTKILSEEISRQNCVSPDFFLKFPSKIDDNYYTNLYIQQLQNFNPRNGNDAWKLTKNLISFLKNDRATSWAAETNGSKVFTRLYTAVKESVKNNEMSRDKAKEICQDVVSSQYPRKNTEPFDFIYKVLSHAPIHGEGSINELWEVSKEIEDKDYLVTLAPALLAHVENEQPQKLYELCEFLLDNGIMSLEKLTDSARSSQKSEHYYIGILRYGDKKPQEQLDYLVNKAGKTDDEAMTFLSKYFPKSHKKILKDRKPSAIQKVSDMFKNMFGKKQTGN